MSQTSDQIAYGVDMTMDGAIYITGFLVSFVRGGQDCFIMRLSYNLNIVYMKSFGEAYNEYCKSIQVTRNNDYIYLGGERLNTLTGKNEIFFVKLTAYGDTLETTAKFLAYTESLSLRRILLTQGNAFSGTSDENEVFFCGATTSNNGDYFFGKLDKTFTITGMYRYGSPENEEQADCTLTLDNQYLVGMFSTNYHRPRGAITPPNGPYVNDTYKDYDLLHPYENCTDIKVDTSTNKGKGLGGGARVKGTQEVDGLLGWVSCDVYDVTKRIENILGGPIPTTGTDNFCIDQYQKSFTDYFTAQTDVHSWTTCESSFIDFSNAECRREFSFKMSYCNNYVTDSTREDATFTIITVTGFLLNGAPNGGTPGYTDYFTCEQAWNFQYGGVAPTLPSFSTGGATFIADMWDNLMTYGKDKWYPYTFCSKSSVAGQRDNFYFVFEQDCKDDPLNTNDRTLSYDWFLIRVKTSDLDGTLNSNIPETAAYFGDRTGDEIPTSVFVDEFGFITMHGTSKSSTFGSTNGEAIWLSAKTHWEMHYEMKVQSALYSPQYPFMSKRFIKPKKFKNEPGFSFLNLYMPSLAADKGTISFYQPRAINRAINGVPYEYFGVSPSVTYKNTYGYVSDWVTDNSLQQSLFGYSHFSLSNQFIYKVSKGARIAVSAPQFCSKTLSLVARNFNTDIPTKIGGISGVYSTIDSKSLLVYQGTATASENTYYPYLWAYSDSSLSDTARFSCPQVNFWAIQNSKSYPSFNRFQQANRLRFIVDDRYTKPPEIKKNIADAKILIGKRYNSPSYLSSSTETPFQNTCSIYYAMQSRVTDSGSTLSTKNLPLWVQFHERNGTFTMYPDTVTTATPYSLEVYCCNKIKECAVNSFQVHVYDTDPVLDQSRFAKTFVINLDSVDNVGEAFNWYPQKSFLYDPDIVTDSSDTYSSQSHTVKITHTSADKGFKSVTNMGLFFGQAYQTPSLNANLGANQVTFKYEDRYSQNQVFSNNYLTVLVNSVPQPTAAAISYTFDNLDPSKLLYRRSQQSNYFDAYFPGLLDKDAPPPSVSIPLPTWFTDPDGGSLMYSVTLSDGSQRPEWMLYESQTETLKGYPDMIQGSELYQLEMKATDLQGATAKIIKSVLVNTVPQLVKEQYVSFTFGVGRKISVKIVGRYIQDLDGDSLELTMPRQKDYLELASYGLELVSETGSIEGKPTLPGRLSLLQLKATDVHGAYVLFYLTLKFVDAKPLRRLNLKDQLITAGLPFHFTIPDEAYYSQDEALVLFIADDLDQQQQLPQWLHFNPRERIFYGGAPPNEQSVRVHVRAMSPTTHDSIPDSFKVTVRQPLHPRMRTEIRPQDMIVLQGHRFEQSLNRGMFSYLIGEQTFTFTQSWNCQQPPKWIHFNQVNMSIHGQALEVGSYHFNILVSDSLNRTLGTNFKLTVQKRDITPILIGQTPFYVVTFASLLGMSLFLIYMMHLSYRNRPNFKKMRAMERSQQRFGGHQKIDLKYYQLETQEKEKGVYVQVDQSVAITENEKFSLSFQKQGFVKRKDFDEF